MAEGGRRGSGGPSQGRGPRAGRERAGDVVRAERDGSAGGSRSAVIGVGAVERRLQARLTPDRMAGTAGAARSAPAPADGTKRGWRILQVALSAGIATA